MIQSVAEQYSGTISRPKNGETSGANLLYSDFGVPFDMAAIAESMGVPSQRVTRPEEIKPALEKALTTPGPALLDMIIDGSL